MVFQYVAAFKRDMTEILNEETKIEPTGVQDACLPQKKKAYARAVPILLRVWQSAAELNKNTRRTPDTTFQGHAGSAGALDKGLGVT